MQVSNVSWHYNLYCKAAEAWFTFLGRGHDNSYYGPSRFGREKWFEASNLCFYVRVITVWAPTMFLLQLSPLLALWLTFYTIPKAAFGLLAFYTALGAFLGILAIFAACIGLFMALVVFVFIDDPLGIVHAIGKPFRVVGSFFAILGAWLWAKKQRICPTIEFVPPEVNNG